MKKLNPTEMNPVVRRFVEEACACLDIKISWSGEREGEKGFDQDGNCIVKVDPRYYRPTEVDTLLGDPSLAKSELGWEPECTFKELVADMVQSDLRLARQEALIAESEC